MKFDRNFFAFILIASIILPLVVNNFTANPSIVHAPNPVFDASCSDIFSINMNSPGEPQGNSTVSCNITHAANTLAVVYAASYLSGDFSINATSSLTLISGANVTDDTNGAYTWSFYRYFTNSGTDTISVTFNVGEGPATDIWTYLNVITFKNTQSPYVENINTNIYRGSGSISTTGVNATVTSGTQGRLLYQGMFCASFGTPILLTQYGETVVGQFVNSQLRSNWNGTAYQVGYMADAGGATNMRVQCSVGSPDTLGWNTVVFGIIPSTSTSTSTFTPQQIQLMSLVPLFMVIGIILLLIKKRGMSS